MFIEWISQHLDQPTSILLLFFNSFLSATILPLGSEILYLTLLKFSQHAGITLFLAATIGNSLGGITNLYLGLFLSKKWKERKARDQSVSNPPKLKNESKRKRTLRIYAYKLIKKYGYWTLLGSWLPIIGDVICVIAGWKKLNIWKSILMISLGKAFRYLFLLLPFYY